MTASLLTVGVVCVIAAIVGGGLKAAGILELPLLQSVRRQVLLGLFGASLIIASAWRDIVPPPRASALPTPAAHPAEVAPPAISTAESTLSSASPCYAFEDSPVLTSDIADAINSSLAGYIQHLNALGFTCPKQKVPIKITSSKAMSSGFISEYDPTTDKIMILPSVAVDQDSPRKEIANYLLSQYRPDLIRSLAGSRILNNLSQYFVCSYSNNPRFGATTATILRLQKPYFYLMNNSFTYEPVDPQDPARAYNVEVWDGAFWEIRSHLGAAYTDALLARAWREFPNGDSDSAVDENFAGSLVQLATPHAPLVSEILRRRGFPVAKP